MGQLTYRKATPGDARVLAARNKDLIEDERHRNRMSVDELADRMARWLAGEYQAIIFEMDGRFAAYALFREHPVEHRDGGKICSYDPVSQLSCFCQAAGPYSHHMLIVRHRPPHGQASLLTRPLAYLATTRFAKHAPSVSNRAK
jgi:hypothetical protein